MSAMFAAIQARDKGLFIRYKQVLLRDVASGVQNIQIMERSIN